MLDKTSAFLKKSETLCVPLCMVLLYGVNVCASGFALLREALLILGPRVFHLNLVPKSSQRSYEQWLHKALKDVLLHCAGAQSSSGSPGLCLPRLCSSSHLAVQLRSLQITEGEATHQPRLLTHFPLAQLTHKSGLLRQHQFLFLVLLLCSVKPHQSSLWTLLTHDVCLILTPQSHSCSPIRTFPHSHSKSDFPVFHLQNVP